MEAPFIEDKIKNSTNSKITIMQIIPAMVNGGVERGVIDIAKAIKNAGFESIVVSSGGMLTYQLKEAKVNHIELDVRSKNLISLLSRINKLKNLIIENQVDIIHVRSRMPALIAYFAAKKTNVKIISTVHGNYSLDLAFFKNFFLKKIYNAMMLKADHIIAVSNFIKKYLIENYCKDKQNFNSKIIDKISVIHRGVDLKYFDPTKVTQSRIVNLINDWKIPEDKKIILFPARFTAWKGHYFLINSLKKVFSEKNNQNFFCIIAGSDHGHVKYRKKIEDYIIKLGLSENIKIVGVCKDMPTAYAISDIVISASIKAEAFGRIATETQAMKKIIIATKIGGALETTIEGETGFLVEVNNEEEFAEKINQALNLNIEDAKIIGEKARRNIEENFSNEKMCLETIKIYRNILSKN
jgi:glycosyltransferase involved in cell wall biosynthesis